MALNLSGKYWQISELEKKLGVPSYKLYPILKSMPRVIKIGYSYLMPDFLMPTLLNKLEIKKNYSIKTTARLTNSNPEFIKLLIANGLPCLIKGLDEPRIDKKYIFPIQKAILEMRNKTDLKKTALAMEVVSLVEEYIKTKKGVENV